MSRSELNTEFIIRSSPYQRYFLTLFYVFSAIALLLCAIAFWLKLCALLTLLVGLYWHLHCLKARPAIQLYYQERSGWFVDHANELIPIQIAPSTVLTSWVILLHYQIFPHSKRHSLPCFKDALSAKDYKKLYVLLKIAGLQQ